MATFEDRSLVQRRHLLVLGATAAVIPACGGATDPLGGPYGGTTSSLPGPTSGGSAAGGDDGGSGGAGGASDSGSGMTEDSGSAGGGTADGGTSADSGSASGGGSTDSGSGGGTTCATAKLTLTFAKYPALMNAGGSAAVSAPGYSDPSCGLDAIIVVCTAAGQYDAYSAACDHACCTVNATGSGYKCPCHGATWDASGTLTRGPARNNLAKLAVCADSTGVHVTY